LGHVLVGSWSCSNQPLPHQGLSQQVYRLLTGTGFHLELNDWNRTRERRCFCLPGEDGIKKIGYAKRERAARTHGGENLDLLYKRKEICQRTFINVEYDSFAQPHSGFKSPTIYVGLFSFVTCYILGSCFCVVSCRS
jgi:hypothetical protein